jgi:hypothetical protein
MHPEAGVTEWSAGGTAVEAAAVLLGCLVLLRLVVRAGATALARGVHLMRHGARRVLLALRPSIARRLLAAALGLVTPAALGAPGAAATVSSPERPMLVPQPAPQTREHRGIHVVRRGDTLWDIARRHLPAAAGPARIARAWPRWYAANRGVIGPDPSVILPGQRLLVPGRRSAGTPTQPHAAPAPPGTSVPSAPSLDPDRR